MKFLVLSLFFILGACDAASTDQEQPQTESQEQIPEDPALQGATNPNEVVFVVKVLEAYEDSQSICGLSKTNVFLVEVVEVKEGGTGVSHMPNKSQEMLVNFLLPAQNIEANVLLEAVAKESLCPDTSKSYFTVKNFEILE